MEKYLIFETADRFFGVNLKYVLKIKNTTKKRIKDVNIKTKITINKIAKAEINQMILVI